jgi:hypothetical protein
MEMDLKKGKRWKDSNGWRWYLPEGATIPAISVTTIVGQHIVPRLEKWKESMLRESINAAIISGDMARLGRAVDTAFSKGEKAAALGTSVHTMLEAYHKTGEKLPTTTDEGLVLEKYIKKISPMVEEVIGLEMSLVHPTYCFAGTVDKLSRIDGKLTVVDYKTGFISESTGHQLAAYSLMLQTMGHNVEALMAVSLPIKDMTKNVSFTKYAHLDFCECAFLWNFMAWKANNFNILTKYGIPDPDDKSKIYKWPIDLAVSDVVLDNYRRKGLL